MPWPTPAASPGWTGRGSPPRPGGAPRSEPRSTRPTVSASSSHQTRSSPGCREEAAHAGASNKRILPLLHRPVPTAWCARRRRSQLDRFDQGASFDQAFSTLVRALETEPEHLRTHTRLLVRAKEWETNTRNRSYLLRGQDLTGAESASQGKEPAQTRRPCTGERVGSRHSTAWNARAHPLGSSSLTGGKTRPGTQGDSQTI